MNRNVESTEEHITLSLFAVDERQRLIIIDMNLCIFRFIMLPQ